MATKYRNQRSASEDEDSHNYVEEESEAMTLEEESEPYEYSYRDAVLDFLYSRRILLTGLALLLAAIALPLWNVGIPIRTAAGDVEDTISAGRILLSLGICIGAAVLLEHALAEFSLAQLRIVGRGAFWYYINELSVFISFGLSVAAFHANISYSSKDFYFENSYKLHLSICGILKIMLLTIVLLAVQHILVKNTALSFHHGLYIDRVRRCLLFDYFINLIDKGAEAEEDSPLILEKKFRARNVESLGLNSKRILLKEFQALVSSTTTYSGSLPVILAKIRSVASNKANKLVRRLIRTDKAERIGDLSSRFRDLNSFSYILDQLDLNRDERIERTNISRIIEKAYKERYVVYKSIEQLNAAIDKVALCAKISTIVFAGITAYIAAIKDKTHVFGIVSTIFGAQFVNRIISDSVVRALLFLFIIHPFDVGDRVVITLNDTEENLMVAELNVFSTLFYRWDGTSVFIPNHVLADRSIANIRRSGPTMENHSIQIDAGTDPSKLYALRQMLLEFVRAHSATYTDYVLVNYEKIENSAKLFIKVLVQYQTNCQNYEFYLKKRSAFIIELNRCLHSLGITYSLPLQRIKVNRPELLLKG